MFIIVITVENTDDVTAGELQAFVDGVIQTVIWLGHQVGDSMLIAAHVLQRFVRGVTIDEDDLEIWIGLADNAVESPGDRVLHVPNRHYDREADGIFLLIGYWSLAGVNGLLLPCLQSRRSMLVQQDARFV